MKIRFFRPAASRALRLFTRILFLIAILSLTFANLIVFTPVLAACVVTGTVYQDYNAGGTQDAREPGVAGITVTAYQTSVVPPGTPPPPIPSLTVGTAVTNATGNYTMNVPTNGEIRIEFTDLPRGLESGRFGTGTSTTTTTFVNCAGAVAGVDLAVNNPGEFCHIVNPQLATSCYVINHQLNGPQANSPTFVAFPNDAAGDPTAGVDDLIHQALANQTGSTWGLAYHRASDSFLVGAYAKRHAGFGPSILPSTALTPESTGAIYRITPGSFNDPNPAAIAANVQVSVFIDLGATTGADPHPPDDVTCTRPPGYLLDCWQYDTNTWPLVSKMSLGDVDVSEDDRTLYAVNLLNRTLVEIPIIQSAIGITAGAPSPISLAGAIAGSGCANADWRPFGLGMHKGLLYLGAVCTAESTQQVADLQAYVYRFDPLNPGLGFTEVLNFALDYPRRCADSAPGCFGGARAADWRPWSNTWPVPSGLGVYRPEPLLTDIVFDGDNMILGFRDRMGDRTGNLRPAPIAPGSNPALLLLGIAAGDTLRACPDAAGNYVLEDNATCGAITTAGANNTEGPDSTLPVPVGGEYYWQDMNDPAANNRHDEVTIGGLVDLPGSDRVAVTVFDPIPPGADPGLFDGGVIWFGHDTGARSQNFRIFNGDIGGPGNTFGKSNGLGDLEAVCGPPPLEIGNRVWEDLDRNGVQDPDELALGGVILQLYMISDSFGRPVNQLIGQTTTTPGGEYYFNESNVFLGAINGVPNVPLPGINFWDTNLNGTVEVHEPVGILPRATYEIRLDNPLNYGGGILTPYYITNPDTTFYNDLNDQTRDSDGRNTAPTTFVSATNFPRTRLTTGNFGVNDHTYDFGFALLPPQQGNITSGSGGSGGLTVTKGVDKPFAAPGEKVIWTITVTNNGSTPATNVSIQDPLPDTLTIQVNDITVSSATGQVSVSGNIVTFTQPIMAVGETVTITIPTIIKSSVGVPFIIVNSVTGYDASAQVLSVTRLPNTGESLWSGWRIPALLLVGGLLLAALLALYGRWRRA